MANGSGSVGTNASKPEGGASRRTARLMAHRIFVRQPQAVSFDDGRWAMMDGKAAIEQEEVGKFHGVSNEFRAWHGDQGAAQPRPVAEEPKDTDAGCKSGGEQ
jgi:hypothetical protein